MHESKDARFVPSCRQCATFCRSPLLQVLRRKLWTFTVYSD